MVSKKGILYIIIFLLALLLCLEHKLRQENYIKNNTVDILVQLSEKLSKSNDGVNITGKEFVLQKSSASTDNKNLQANFKNNDERNSKKEIISQITSPTKPVTRTSKEQSRFLGCKNQFLNISKRIFPENMKEFEAFVESRCTVSKSPNTCINNKLVGPLRVEKEFPSVDILAKELDFVKEGGWWRPVNCKEIAQTAIVIPFRNREHHLPILLRQLHPMLKRQNLHYRIFVIDQVDEFSFNRAKLMNVGFDISQTFFPYSCFVFHDVDLIPENDHIDYGCKTSPAHLSVACDKFGYKLFYATLFGGIEMFTNEDFLKINGFSNSFWNWGGEDDNLYQRILQKKLPLKRQSIAIARYTMIKHDNNVDIKTQSDGDRWKFFEESQLYTDQDGLNTLQYDVMEIVKHKYYTKVKVNLRKDKDKLFGFKKF